MRELSMLQELYYGNIRPWERMRIHTHEYKTLSDKTDGIAEHFRSLLSPEEYEKFSEMQEMQMRLHAMDEVDLFEYAFRTGALLTIDIFNYEGNE